MDSKVSASYFAKFLERNVDNKDLSDEAFRQVVRNTLPIVNKEEPRAKATSESIRVCVDVGGKRIVYRPE